MNDERPLFILAGNGPYANRGCEAIVRGTVKILKNYYKDPSFICISHFRNDKEYNKQSIEEFDKTIIHKKTIRPKGLPCLLYNKIQATLNPVAHKKYMYKEMLPFIKDAQAVLSIGGDNYSLDYGIPTKFTDLDDLILGEKGRIIIWGASIGPFNKLPEYEKYIVDHLQKINGIFARESATIEYLSEKGIAKNVFRTADPAFVMDPKKPNKNNLKIDGEAIGINFSPLMSRYITEGDINAWKKIASKIISKISENTSRKIYLIPHVSSPNRIDDDYLFLRDIKAESNSRNANIVLIPPIYNAAETKWIISQMKIFAGARTHSTVAALSSCVPTLSFAYSIKAKGINRDIFGNDFYCLNPSELKSALILEKIQYMLSNSSDIANDLNTKMLEVKQRALLAGEYLFEITQNKVCV